MITAQPQLKFFETAADSPDVGWLVNLLDGRGWLTASQILRDLIETEPTESAKRRLRSIANASKGKIAGGQQGYKLTRDLTKGEFDEVNGFLLNQAGEMKQRAIDLAREFYAHKPADI